jgi:hypothetical protein
VSAPLVLVAEDFFASPTWDVLTDFVMPLLAILSSGLLAIWLQVREQRRQDLRRREAEAAQAQREESEARTALASAGMKQHEQFAAYAVAPSGKALTRITLFHARAHNMWALSDVPGAGQVGFWLSEKRRVAIDYMYKCVAEKKRPFSILIYFMEIDDRLGQWRNDILDGDWFEADGRRIKQDNPTVEFEIEQAGGEAPSDA